MPHARIAGRLKVVGTVLGNRIFSRSIQPQMPGTVLARECLPVNFLL
jgi:hypothetical protein